MVFLTSDPDDGYSLELSKDLVSHMLDIMHTMMNLALQVTGLALCIHARTHQDWVHSHVDPANADHQTPAER